MHYPANLNSGNNIAVQFHTRQDSNAIVACAEFYCDLISNQYIYIYVDMGWADMSLAYYPGVRRIKRVLWGWKPTFLNVHLKAKIK